MDFFKYRRSVDDEDYDYDYDNLDPFIASFSQDIVLCLVISIISICFFIFILAKKELRGMPTCWLVINILLAAMVRGILILPMSAATYTGGWKTGVFGCHFYIVLNTINYMHIHVGLLLLLIDHFISFVDQKKHAERMTPKVVRILIVSSLVMVFTVGILVIYLTGIPRVSYVGVKFQYAYCSFGTTSTGLSIQVSLTKTFPVAQNILFGFITLFTTIAMRSKLNSDDQEEGVKNWQAVALILLSGFLNVLLCLPMTLYMLFFFDIFGTETWFIVNFLDNLFYVLIPILIMVLIPEIRITMGSCCKKEKKGENQPLVKPM